ncbi:hypothetical protein CEXT_672481 [Caerostris extrusa]|uniref:Secreted protein n=1 Tax=Caerostris extrusa TaxID=172846 RepID=A0AAV4PSE9_CAEEX|nr:hypothetical protein CEXT_672481 [Caerostris extrusa]
MVLEFESVELTFILVRVVLVAAVSVRRHGIKQQRASARSCPPVKRAVEARDISFITRCFLNSGQGQWEPLFAEKNLIASYIPFTPKRKNILPSLLTDVPPLGLPHGPSLSALVTLCRRERKEKREGNAIAAMVSEKTAMACYNRRRSFASARAAFLQVLMVSKSSKIARNRTQGSALNGKKSWRTES